MSTAKTKIIKITDASTYHLLTDPVMALKAGQAVGMPTETVYGLAADCLNSEAVESIFRIKGRPMDNPLICHISSLEMLKVLVDPQWSVTESVMRVIDAFWPGPLTLLLPAHPNLPKCVTAGLETVGVRFPSHPVAQELIRLAGVPLAAPSANLSGRPSPTTAEHVFTDLHDRIDWIVDGGNCDVGLESTVVDLLKSPPLILRPGGITQKMLHTIVPDVKVYQQKKFRSVSIDCINNVNDEDSIDLDESRPSTPGMKYKHYAPNAPVLLFALKDVPAATLSVSEISGLLAPRIREHLNRSGKILDGAKIIRLRVSKDSSSDISDASIFKEIFLSETGDLSEIAQNLFSALREADKETPDLIVAEAVIEDDGGLAIMNRLIKSAGEEILYI